MTVSLLGGGGHASDVLSVVEALIAEGCAEGPVWVADDRWDRPDRFDQRCVKVVESIEAGARLAPYIVSVGYPKGRVAVDQIAVAAGGSPADPLVHPQSTVSEFVTAFAGVVVMGQVWISAGVRIGEHSHISYGATIGHDTTIGSFCSVMPCASLGGDVVIGDGVLIGANATVLQGVNLGSGCVVGAGATVVGDVPSGATVVGTPAKPLAVPSPPN